MPLKSYVKVKSGWWKLIPWLNKYTANAIYPNVYLPKEIYDNLKSQNPDPRNVATLIHEETHLKREKEIGPVRFGIKYLLSSKFRFNEELEAHKEAFKFLKRRKIKPNIERTAKFLSGWIYLWPVSFEIAKKELEKAWEEA